MLSEDYIPISALNQYDYCPHRCYLILVEHEFAHNEHTVAGTLEHRRVHSGVNEKRGALVQYRSSWLYSGKYGLYGCADLIEEIERPDRPARIYPVEFKHGKRGDWVNDQLQLCAQALCLEDMLGLSPIPAAFVFYEQTGRRMEVQLDERVRSLTAETVERVREMMGTGGCPPAVYSKRCRGCSLYRICLPRETDRLRKAILRDRAAGAQ